MSRERTVKGFVLKKQDYNEADQIVTIFSEEEGKIRALVKAANKSTSKLRPALQPLFQSAVTLTGNAGGLGMMKVIRAQSITVYSGILESPEKLSAWYIAAELVIRSLPDGEPNQSLYKELENFAKFLHEVDLNGSGVKKTIIQFQIKVMRLIGLGIRSFSVQATASTRIRFSLDYGGFILDDVIDGVPISFDVYEAFLLLDKQDYYNGQEISNETISELQKIVNRFVSYQLEREIKSQKYMV